jgi:hypothetical protein
MLGAFEHRSEHLLPTRHFLRRVVRFAALAAAIIGASLAIGVSGYHWLGGLPWIDALLNAAMILTGMGPVDRMQTVPGKLFAAGYALFSGLAFVSMVAVLSAPIIHRFFHALHLEADENRPPDDPAARR